MSPITHLLASWSGSTLARLRGRDLRLVAFAGVAPDLDGLGLAVDLANLALGRGEGFPLYWQYHHALLHGLPGAAVIALLAAGAAMRRLTVLVGAFLAVHLHLLCDLVGSRGPEPIDIWPIPYLAPLSPRLELEWSGQWPLASWQNLVVTLVLMTHAVVSAVRAGRSPVGLFSARADAVFVETLRRRLRSLRG